MKEKNKEISQIDNLVARNIQIRRKMLGLSQANISDYLEISTQQVNKYERGTNRISSGKLYKIAQLLKMPIEYFFNEKPIYLNKDKENML